MRPSFWILSTGTELSQGRSKDTNSSEIARQLSDHGFDVKGISILPDDPKMLLTYLQWLSGQSDLNGLIMTGGLGPTSDDHTINMLSEFTGQKIIEDPKAKRRLEAITRRRSGINFDAARLQIRVLAETAVIDNHTGLAPGILGSVSRNTTGLPFYFTALPGVPTEMQSMCKVAIQILQDKLKPASVHRIDFYIYDEPESDFQKSIFNSNGLCPESLKHDPDFRWGISATPGCLKLFLEHESDLSAIDDLRQKIQQFYQLRYTERPIDELLPELLINQALTVSLAESCTGGLIAKLITDRSGSSSYFMGSAVTYSNQSKSDLLHVDQKIINEYGAVSEECAHAMAKQARKAFGSDIAVSVTGIAGPTGGSKEKPVGTVFCSFNSETSERTFRLFFPLDRQRVREYTANTVLYRLYSWLIQSARQNAKVGTG